ncbi:Rap1 GTPase-GDP dissociation stimulator 1 [Phlyctochytrium bullatum]|nr:Rap1 GTPase-GDP dissociation stimulator 1 [Phlyctochytrium bullatum]
MSSLAAKLQQLSLTEAADELEHLPVPETEDDRVALTSSPEVVRHLIELLGQASSNLSQRLKVKESTGCGTLVARLVAELCKSEQPRNEIGNSSPFRPLVELLWFSTESLRDGAAPSTTDDALAIQTLRALANLCYENEMNRDYLNEVNDGIRAISTCLKSSNSTILRTVCGGLLNITMDNEPIQQQAISSGCLDGLIDVIAKGSRDPVYKPFIPAAVRALSNLIEIESGIQRLFETNGLAVLVLTLKAQHQTILRNGCPPEDYAFAMETIETIATSLETIGDHDAVQREIVKVDALDTLLDFVDEPPPQEYETYDDEEIPDYHNVRKCISRFVTLVTMNDGNMVELSHNKKVVGRFKNWMTLGLKTRSDREEDEIRMSGALSIGNLARSDDTCALLMREHDIGKALLELLLMEKKRLQEHGIREDTKSCIKVLHAVVGALKNLSISASERTALGELGIIPYVTELLELDGVRPIQFSCLGILKNLCGGANELNTFRIVTGVEPPADEDRISNLKHLAKIVDNAPIRKIIRLTWQATGDNQAGVRNEGARVVVNLVRTCHLCQAPFLIRAIVDVNGIVPLMQIVTGALLTRPRNNDESGGDGDASDEHHVHFDALPSEGQVYPLVQNEGLVALILIANACPEAIPDIIRYHASLVPTAVTILKSNLPTEQVDEGARTERKLDYSDAIKVNVCLLLGALVVGDASFKARVKAALDPILPPLVKWTSESNLAVSSAASAAANASMIANAPASPPPPVALSRTQTKSARNLPSAGFYTGGGGQGAKDRNATVEIAPVAGGGRAATPRNAAEEGVMLVDALKRLVAVL